MKTIGLSLLVCVLVACSSSSGNNDSGPSGDLAPDVPQPDMFVPDVPPSNPIVTAMTPDNGPACPKANPADTNCTGATTVTLSGQNFKAGATVFVNGGTAEGYIITQVNILPSSITFQLPKNPTDPVNPNKPSKVSVVVIQEQVSSDTFFFQYWTSKDATATFKGSIISDNATTFSKFPSETAIEGRVLLDGETNAGAGPLPMSTLLGQVGFGPTGESPVDNPKWRWFDASFDSDQGDYDHYTSNPVAPLNGTFDMAFRFSDDGGQSWIFTDKDEANLAYETSQAATVDVTAPPAFYCQIDDHCKLELLRVACDEANNVCVGCTADADCVNNVNSLGNRCDTVQQVCFCQDAGDCTNPQGPTCVQNGQYCGCEAPAECTAPETCVMTTYGGVQVQRCAEIPPDAGI